MNNATVDAIGVVLNYYIAPTVTGSTVISSANYANGEADFFDVLIGASQTGGFWEMLAR